MSDASLTSEQSATPKTNAVARFVKNEHGDWVDTVPTEFARIQERRIAELEKALEPFSRPQIFEECDQIAKLITQISRNPVSGADAWRWWFGRHFCIQHFKDARTAVQGAQP